MVMVTNEAPRLIMKKIATNAVVLVAASALFIAITTFLDGGNIGYPAVIIAVILFAALSFDVYSFATKNPTRQVTVRFSDSKIEEKLHAVLHFLGYRLENSQGNNRLYKPSFWIGGLNGKVTMRYDRNQVVITGPLFAIGRIEERLWLFSYPGVSWYQSDGRPEPHYAEAGFDASHTEPVAPYGVNTGYEPVGGASVAGGR